jgi:hypothetical protein
VWLVIFYDAYLETRGIGAYQKKLTIRSNRLVPQAEIESQLTGINRYELVGLEFNKTDNRLSITYSIEARRDALEVLTDRLAETAWVDSYTIE